MRLSDEAQELLELIRDANPQIVMVKEPSSITRVLHITIGGGGDVVKGKTSKSEEYRKAIDELLRAGELEWGGRDWLQIPEEKR